MSSEINNEDIDDVPEDKTQKKVGMSKYEASDLEKVTDYAEEKEISSECQDFSDDLTEIGDRINKETAEKIAREKELLKVSIKKEDVDLIVKEMEINRTIAERTLREHHGNLVAALTALTD